VALSLVLVASACGGGGDGGGSTGGGGTGGGGTTTKPAIDAATSTDLDTVPDTGLETGTTVVDGDDEFAASPEFCAAWKKAQSLPGGIFFGDEGVEGLIISFRQQLTEALGLAPEELKPSIQELLDIEIDPNDPLASSPMFRPIVAEIDLFVAENCAPIPQPTFTFDRLEQSGGGWVVFVTGVCPDGSFPVDVTGPADPFSPRFTAVDLGNGSYSFGTYDVPIDPAGYTEEQFLDEFGILGGTNGSCT